MDFHRTLLSGIKVYISTRLNTLSKEIKAEIPKKVSELENDKEYLTEHQDLSSYAQKDELPTALSDLTEDETHRLVTDEEKENWNNTSWNELTDRPFYNETVKTLIYEDVLSNGTLTNNKNAYWYVDTLDVNVKLNIGDTVCVSVNGTEYYCEVTKTNRNDRYGIGDIRFYTGANDTSNPSAMDESETPFYIMYDVYDNGLYNDIYFGLEETDIKIYTCTGDIKLLDEKFIPDTISRVGHTHGIDDLDDSIFKRKEYIIIDALNGLPYVIQSHNGVLVTFSQTTGIEITEAPSNVRYFEGDTFDPTGMVVSAIGADGTTRVITNYTISPEVLTAETTNVVISYTEGNEVFETSVGITLSSIADLLIDFEYTTSIVSEADATEDMPAGTYYTITDWKGTYNGEPSTEMIVPENKFIIF